MATAQIRTDRTTIWERIWSSPLRREVTVALAVKVFLLLVIWGLFFGASVQVRPDHHALEQFLLTSQAPVTANGDLRGTNFSPGSRP